MAHAGQRDLHERHRLPRRDRGTAQGTQPDDEYRVAAAVDRRFNVSTSPGRRDLHGCGGFIVVADAQPAAPDIPSGVLLQPLGSTGEARTGRCARAPCCSATSIATRNRSTSRLDRITASSRVDPITVSRHISTLVVNGGIFDRRPQRLRDQEADVDVDRERACLDRAVLAEPAAGSTSSRTARTATSRRASSSRPTAPSSSARCARSSCKTLTATVGQPLDLTAWAADQPPTTVFEAEGGGAGQLQPLLVKRANRRRTSPCPLLSAAA